MDAFDVAILGLRIALVLLLYLFLAVVVRLAARGLNASVPSARPVVLRLVVEEPAASDLASGSVIAVRDATTIGRGQVAGVVVADPTVSTEHARIAQQGNAWTIIDLDSTNGTLLNQRRIDGATPLAAGDVVALGNVRLRVLAT